MKEVPQSSNSATVSGNNYLHKVDAGLTHRSSLCIDTQCVVKLWCPKARFERWVAQSEDGKLGSQLATPLINRFAPP
ncbi:hypothetical protein L1987_75886 [Smallanthus sonchifolius]|uniref:Uncharacterized protein n=1 Tax=Smallanthus sonchifolius TaxID=185202 RepID=A0ACB9A674_9ASTR|nr:hypothetical protein L1987_75886 [Smallanthus sonchifolius]